MRMLAMEEIVPTPLLRPTMSRTQDAWTRFNRELPRWECSRHIVIVFLYHRVVVTTAVMGLLFSVLQLKIGATCCNLSW